MRPSPDPARASGVRCFVPALLAATLGLAACAYQTAPGPVAVAPPPAYYEPPVVVGGVYYGWHPWHGWYHHPWHGWHHGWHR